MKAHVQNPWTRSPSLMVNMSVEAVGQLRKALTNITENTFDRLTPNQVAAVEDLLRELQHASSTPLPRGLKDVVP